MTRLRSLIKEILSSPKKKDCGCGCNDCGDKAPTLTEGKFKSLVSEGLQHHIDKKISLFESVYRIGSDKHLGLIREARALWIRGIIEVSDDDKGLLETHLGHFGLYEGVEVPLDLPMLNEEFKVGDKVTYLGHPAVVTDTKEYNSRDFVSVSYDKGNGATKARMILVKSGDVKAIDEDINEATSKYPGFDLDKNIKYQDTSISSGMWRYTGRESGGKGVYQNLMNNQFLGFSSDDLDLIKKHKGSHFDISESLDEAKLHEVHKLFNQTKLSPAEYQKAKTLKGWKERKDDYEWDSTEGLYVKEKKSKFKKAGEVSGFDMRGIDEEESLEERIVNILEAKKKKKKEKKDPPLNKPKRGGSKAYYVYVRDPKTKKIKKVSFGSGGLRAKIKNKKARNAFAARHKCSTKKDRTKAGYWSCNLPRYADQLGLGSKMNTFW